MSKPKVYVTRKIPDNGLALLAERCEVTVNPEDRPLARAELLANVAEAEGVIGLLSDKIDAEFFDAAKKLKGYANYAVGFDNIDVPEATRRGMPVSNTPEVLTLATAELAWGLIFAVARRIVETDKIMRSGTWTGWGPLQFIGLDITGKTLGIVGAGRIGTAVARMSRGFEMKICYVDNNRNEYMEKELGARKVEFDELLAHADFISLNTNLTPSTRHMFNAAAFKKMKNSAVLVNTARGPCIKEDDLVAALSSGEIGGAGLDVYEFEPKIAQGLKELDNAVVLPHIASATVSSRQGMAELAANNLLAMIFGQKPPTLLNPEILGK